MASPTKAETDRIAERLIGFIREELGDPAVEYDEPPAALPGGFETAIYRFGLNHFGNERHKRFVLRLFPAFRLSENALREHAAQNAMAGEGYPVARSYLLCTDKSVLGGAFFIMDFLPGEPMMSVAIKNIPRILARTHVALHQIDPGPLVKSLLEQGAGGNLYEGENRFLQLDKFEDEMPWLSDCVEWLREYRPPESERLVICHGDFHPQNILMQDGKVTGVIDWPDFRIGDPALDVGSTCWLITVMYRHLAAVLAPAFAQCDWQMFAERYLEAYQAHMPLDRTRIDYYRVLRGIRALEAGFSGQEVLRRPPIVETIIKGIYDVTGIVLRIPE